MSNLPLEGMRIIAVEQYGAGPYGSMYLADLGAEVIKIENPTAGGDISRATGPYFLGDNDSLFFQTFNRNKKSFSLNLKSDAGRTVFEKLIASADAVINNLRGDQPAKLGLDYPSLKHINPKIVCVHLSAYGRDNDRAHWPGYDYLMQAEAGFMSLTGEPGAAPSRFGLSMVDFMTGVTASLGLLAGYIGALRTGVGRDVDVSLFDVAMNQLTYPASWYLNEGHETDRLARSAHPSTVPCQLYKTADSWIFIMAMTPAFWLVLLKGVEREDLAADVRFVDASARRDNRDALTKILDDILCQKSTQHWMAVFAGSLPIAPVNNLPQALNNPYVRQIGLLQSLAHPQKPDMTMLSNPLKLDGSRLAAKVCEPMGANTDSLLLALGYSTQEISHLRSQGAI